MADDHQPGTTRSSGFAFAVIDQKILGALRTIDDRRPHAGSSFGLDPITEWPGSVAARGVEPHVAPDHPHAVDRRPGGKVCDEPWRSVVRCRQPPGRHRIIRGKTPGRINRARTSHRSLKFIERQPSRRRLRTRQGLWCRRRARHVQLTRAINLSQVESHASLKSVRRA